MSETQQAFNLQDEIRALRNCSDISSWRTRVDNNLQYFTREYIVEENITRYSYGLKRGENGLPNQIYSIGYEKDGDILESFQKGLGVRARAECIGFTKIEQEVFAGKLDDGFFIWHSRPGKAEDGFKDHNFTFIGQVLNDQIDVVALRNHINTRDDINFLNQFLKDGEKLENNASDIDLLKNPVFVKGRERFNSHMDIIRALDPDKANNPETSCRWLLDKLQPLRRDILQALEEGKMTEAEENKIAHDRFALGLLKGEITEAELATEDIFAYNARKRRLIAQGAPLLKGSCGLSGKIGGEAMTWSGVEGEYFECPRCHGKIPSGKGITVCPHCGLKKEDAAEKCD